MTGDKAVADDYGPWSIGFTGLGEPTDPVDNTLQLVNTLDQMEGHISAAHDAVMEIAGECLSKCESGNAYCNDCLSGNAVRYASEAEKIHDKINQKMINALNSIVVDSQQSLSDVDGIADFIQTGGGDNLPPAQVPANPQTVEQLNLIATEAGQIARGEISGPSATTHDANSVVSVNEPSSGNTIPLFPPEQPSGNSELPAGCKCPEGTSWTGIPDGVTGKIVWGCRKPGSLSTVQPECLPLPPVTPPGQCVELSDAFPVDPECITYCVNGVPATADEIIDHCKASVLCGMSDCSEIIKVGQGELPPAPTPPTESSAEEVCTLSSPDELVDDWVGYLTGTVDGYGYPISTETNPIWITDPSDPASFIEVPVGETDPNLQPPELPDQSEDDVIQQILRNDGKAQVCKVQQPRVTTLDQLPALKEFDLCDINSHKKIDAVVNRYIETVTKLPADSGGGLIEGTKQIASLLQGTDQNISAISNTAIYGYAATIYVETMKNYLNMDIFYRTFPNPDSCSIYSMMVGIFLGNVVSHIDEQLLKSSPFIGKQIEYLRNYACQYIIPCPDDADFMYMHGRIDSEQWEYLQKVGGYCIDWQKKYIEAARPQIPANVVYGWCRAELIDKDERDNLLRYVGIDGDTARDNFEFMSEAIPPFSDIIRLMVRDVEDEEVVQKYKLDEDFSDKYKGNLKEWAQRQNISDDIACKEWRAHWMWPSVGQGYEMLHRLREDANVGDIDTGKLVFTKDDLQEMMKIADIVPGMIDKLIAISYRPMGIRQIARAYETNTITADDAKGRYQDLGYSAKDANVLCKYLQTDSAERRAKFLGQPLPSKLSTYYKEGLIDQTQYATALHDAGLPDDIIDSRVHTSDVERNIKDIEEMAAAAKRQFLRGEIDESTYQNKLLSYGMDTTRVMGIVARDKEVKSGINKPIAMGKLCKLVQQGLLPAQEYFTRAINYGYKVADASLLVNSCLIEYQEALAKKVKAAIKEAEAEADRQQRLKDKAEKDRQKAILAALPCKPKAKPTCTDIQM